jgi:ABC-type branched-subunit amino acid transport system permease subunit
MKMYESLGLGALIGLVYGAILWFVRHEILYMYSQGIGFHIYYNPNLVAFYTATASALICFIVIFFSDKIYGLFERFALNYMVNKNDEEEDDE